MKPFTELEKVPKTLLAAYVIEPPTPIVFAHNVPPTPTPPATVKAPVLVLAELVVNPIVSPVPDMDTLVFPVTALPAEG